MRILFVAPEVAPFVKVGGLADVVGALPCALRRMGDDVRIVLPLFDSIARDSLRDCGISLEVPMGWGLESCRVFETHLTASGKHSVNPTDDPSSPSVTVYFLDHPGMYARGYVYGGGGPGDDSLARYGLLSRGALELCKRLAFIPDVVHVHDWTTALIPMYLNTVERDGPLANTASVLTIHNLAYQPSFPMHELWVSGLPPHVLREDGILHNGTLNLLKGGIYHASKLTTVSPRYAQEIRTPAYGCGLDTALNFRGGDLIGILNGIDDEVWNPKSDPYIAASFEVDNISGKKQCKQELQRTLGLHEHADVPLIGIISRLTGQKGTDVILQALDRLLALGTQVAVLGAGEPSLEHEFRQRSQRSSGDFRAYIGYSEKLAHQIEAGSDFFLMPSRFEPCGLNQMYSQRYGSLPIVRATGGLDDTVDQCDASRVTGTGFKMWDLYPESLIATVAWGVSVYRNGPLFQAIQRQAMRKDQGWGPAAQRYRDVYRWAIGSRTRTRS